jgi:penicillin-binding protein 1A
VAQPREILNSWRRGVQRLWSRVTRRPPPYHGAPPPPPPYHGAPPPPYPASDPAMQQYLAEIDRQSQLPTVRDVPGYPRHDTQSDEEVTQLWQRVPPPPQPLGRSRAVIANPADGGILYWVGKLYGFAVLVVLAALGVIGVSTYGYFAAEAPPPPDLSQYARVVPAVTRIYAGDGTLLGEFASEWREVVPFEKIPKPMVDAFLSAEDHEFFDHSGIYFKGIVRAAWRNVVAGDFAQGGSTITQQVAKQFLGAEKSLTRKAKEAIVARRLEATYSKKAILAVYLNHIFLGNGAYGVKAAARRYFSKKLEELDIAEMATIAGLAQAPSYYSPVLHPERATARRNAVLDKMARHGFIKQEELKGWQARPLVLKTYRDVFGDRLPYYAEHVRRYITRKYGADAMLERGLRIETAAEPVTEVLAYENVAFGARRQDKRQGWRGPEAYLDEGRPREVFRERVRALYGAKPLVPDRRYLALVEEVSANQAEVLVGGETYKLPLDNARWAAPWSKKDDSNDRTITSLSKALKVGDVVWVSADQPLSKQFEDWTNESPRWKVPANPDRLERLREQAAGRVRLEQVPHPQSAIFTADHTTGYVVSMVGGTDHDRSQYNRAVQACRQPGSTYKPIYYSAALDEGYGFDTALGDVPRGEVDPITGEIWIPKNLGGTVDFVVNMEYALVFSKNIPSVGLFKKVGADKVKAWAQRLGFSTEIIADKALALGASCTTLDELTRAFAIFARNGKWIDWVYVRRVFDRTGNLIEDNTVYYDPMLPADDRLDRLAATAGIAPKQAIPARAAFLTNKLLAQVITHGFARVIRDTGIHAAGKTGTSSFTMDTTFIGYTSRWISTVWMGDDMRERPLGRTDAAYIVVEPMWARFMAQAAIGHPNREIPWEVPPGVDPKDRGEHAKGSKKTMSLVYRERSGPPPAVLPPDG